MVDVDQGPPQKGFPSECSFFFTHQESENLGMEKVINERHCGHSFFATCEGQAKHLGKTPGNRQKRRTTSK